MAEKKVVAAKGEIGGLQFELGRHEASFVAESPEDVGLVDGEPVGDAVRDAGGEEVSVVGEPFGAVGIEPAVLLLKGVGVVEVVDGDEGRDLCGEKSIDDLVVVGEGFFVGLAFALREDARPAHGKAIGVEAEIAHVADVFGEAMVFVGGDPVGAAVLDGSGLGFIGSPDGAAATVGVG